MNKPIGIDQFLNLQNQNSFDNSRNMQNNNNLLLKQALLMQLLNNTNQINSQVNNQFNNQLNGQMNNQINNQIRNKNNQIKNLNMMAKNIINIKFINNKNNNQSLVYEKNNKTNKTKQHIYFSA